MSGGIAGQGARVGPASVRGKTGDLYRTLGQILARLAPLLEAGASSKPTRGNRRPGDSSERRLQLASDPRDHGLPVPWRTLSEQAHGRVPGCVLSMVHPPPV